MASDNPKIDTLTGIINELQDRIAAEPGNADLPPLLTAAQAELKAEIQAAEAAQATAKAASAAPASTTAPATAAAPAPAPAPAPATPAAKVAPAATVRPAVRPAVRPTPPTIATVRPRAATTLVAGNVNASGVTAPDHPSRLPPAARPTPAGPSS